MYAIEVTEYFSQIDKFIKRAVKYGYTNKQPSVVEL